MQKNSKFVLNLVAQMMVFTINLIISFFFTPVILEKLGSEAYGFVGLVNNFVSYISIITTALNSLAGRYITLSYHRKDMQKVNEYSSSVFLADVVLGSGVFFASLILSANIEHLINIPSNLIADVRITIVIVFLSCAISLVGVVFGVAAFIKNRIYLSSLSTMAGSILRIFVLALLFFTLEPHMWYYSISALCAGVLTLLLHYTFTKRLLPEMQIKRRYFRFHRVKEILQSGVWISLESINKMLQTGLDLLVTNIFVNAAAMGLFSVAKQMPAILGQIPTMIASTFNPELARLYAEGKTDELTSQFRFTIKFISFLMIVPLIGFIAFGGEFYRLWLPERSSGEIEMIQLLSILTIVPLLVNAYIEGLYYANTLTNKIRGSVLITFGFSVCSIVTEFILLNALKFEDPLLIIAGTSSCYMVVRHAVVTPLYCAYVLRVPSHNFYLPLIRSIASSVALYFVFYTINEICVIDSWISLVIVCGCAGVVGYILTFFLILNSEERKLAKNIITNLIRRRK